QSSGGHRLRTVNSARTCSTGFVSCGQLWDCGTPARHRLYFRRTPLWRDASDDCPPAHRAGRVAWAGAFVRLLVLDRRASLPPSVESHQFVLFEFISDRVRSCSQASLCSAQSGLHSRESALLFAGGDRGCRNISERRWGETAVNPFQNLCVGAALVAIVLSGC